jgi:hypothetical protein
MRLYLREKRISKTDLRRVAKKYIFGKTIEELQEMLKPGEREKLPVIIALLISALVKEAKSGDVNAFLDRLLEKAANNKE